MSYLLANGCSYTDYNFGKKNCDYNNTYEEKEQLGIPNENWKMRTDRDWETTTIC